MLEQRALPDTDPDFASTKLASVNIPLFCLQLLGSLIWNIAVITIRTATAADASAIWSILKPVFRAGETYTIRRDIDEADAIAYWCGRNHETFVAEDEGNILGTYYLRANQAGGGDHVATCGYMTSSQAQGRGIARMMLEHSLVRAKERGFRAMQFNFVVSTNERAIKTWEAYGFARVGRLPLSFRHPALGFVDAFVMYKQL
jgi:ribosomal protein S18 acetylase RimI-like enzyme